MPIAQEGTVTLKITYSAEGGTNAPADQSKTVTDIYPIDVSIVMSSQTPSRTGYNFLGWCNTLPATSVTNAPGSTYTRTFTAGMTSITTGMFAVWQKKTYAVQYKKGSHGTGTNVTEYKTYGVALKLKGAIFTRTNYIQVGWSKTDGGTQDYSLEASYTANAAITLYPVWKKQTYAYVKVGGAWKEAQIFVKNGGAWKEVTGAYVKVSGAWKPT